MPAGNRLLPTDREKASEDVFTSHDFVRTIGANINHKRRGQTLEVEMEVHDGPTLGIDGTIGQLVARGR